MKVILAVTGCIGAYKAAYILRRLQERGCDVLPVMTAHAQRFLGPITLEKLAGHKVIADLFEDDTSKIAHIAVARESEVLVVAPATANVIAKFANGIADDFLSTLFLSTTTPVVVAPAMNVEMWQHPATCRNLEVLRSQGVLIVEPEAGYLACGELGEGRLASEESIVEAVFDAAKTRHTLAGRKVLVTAGPTIEDIDPVRFLSNRSSGKMGVRIAEEAIRRGADVTLVIGPVQIELPEKAGRLVQVRSAEEMLSAVRENFDQAEVVIMAAAVSDFKPKVLAGNKIKKKSALDSLELRPTIDILGALAKEKGERYLVGFAAESESLSSNARQKLVAKNLDLIIANDITEPGLGFGSESNRVVLIDRTKERELPALPKAEIARIVWDRIETELKGEMAVVGVGGN